MTAKEQDTTDMKVRYDYVKVCTLGVLPKKNLELVNEQRGLYLACRITHCGLCEGAGCNDCNEAGYYLELDTAIPMCLNFTAIHTDDLG